jgi:hypothetical protein
MVGRFKFRFFFDGDSGACLWSANDVARETWGYPVDHEKLPLSEPTITRLNEIVRRYDECFDWNDPAGPGPWGKREGEEFNRMADEVLASLREELGAEFEIVDEFRRF